MHWATRSLPLLRSQCSSNSPIRWSLGLSFHIWGLGRLAPVLASSGASPVSYSPILSPYCSSLCIFPKSFRKKYQVTNLMRSLASLMCRLALFHPYTHTHTHTHTHTSLKPQGKAQPNLSLTPLPCEFDSQPYRRLTASWTQSTFSSLYVFNPSWITLSIFFHINSCPLKTLPCFCWGPQVRLHTLLPSSHTRSLSNLPTP